MKTAQDYPITFPFGATTKPYSPSNPHSGNDRAMLVGVPVVIQGVTIGLSGRSGKVTGAHLHTQRGKTKLCKPATSPTSLEFKGGLVVATRNVDEGEWGKYVMLAVDGEYIVYCHLSEVYAKIGQVIESNSMAIITNSDSWYSRCNDTHTRIRGRVLDRNTFKSYVGKDFLKFVEDCSDNPEADAQYKYSVIGRQASTQFEEVTEKLYRKKSV